MRWLQHFAEMDRLYEAACEVEGAIEECIGAEEFTEAARLRGIHAEIQERDDVYTIHKVTMSIHKQSSVCRWKALLAFMHCGC